MMYNLCICGATGLVGMKMLEVLEKSELKINKITLLASSRSAGKIIRFKKQDHTVNELNENSFDDMDIVLFALESQLAAYYVPIAIKKGCIVIDNSSYFRLYNDVPLISYDVNVDDIKNSNLIANPNCSTIQASIVLKSLQEFAIKRLTIVTLQAVSGSGSRGVDALDGKNLFYGDDIRKTCIAKIGNFLENGYTEEEIKMHHEINKIFHQNWEISATCIRVPIYNGHSISIECEFETDVNVDEIIASLSKNPQVVIVDSYPTVLMCQNEMQVYLGRIRQNMDSLNKITLFCVADNLLVGAASNACNILNKIKS